METETETTKVKENKKIHKKGSRLHKSLTKKSNKKRKYRRKIKSFHKLQRHNSRPLDWKHKTLKSWKPLKRILKGGDVNDKFQKKFNDFLNTKYDIKLDGDYEIIDGPDVDDMNDTVVVTAEPVTNNTSVKTITDAKVVNENDNKRPCSSTEVRDAFCYFYETIKKDLKGRFNDPCDGNTSIINEISSGLINNDEKIQDNNDDYDEDANEDGNKDENIYNSRSIIKHFSGGRKKTERRKKQKEKKGTRKKVAIKKNKLKG
jgi:hypothetical protein